MPAHEGIVIYVVRQRRSNWELRTREPAMKYRHPRTVVSAGCLLNTSAVPNRCPRAAWRYVEMKSTARLSAVIALVLALSFSALAASQAAPVQKDSAAPVQKVNNTVPADQQRMRGLDEQVQEVKTDVLSIAAELNQLEEKLVYPSGTQVAVFVALAKGDQMRLDAVRIQIDGQLVAHYLYSAKELEALRKGGVQRIYVGNVATGEHKLEVLVDGKLKDADINRTEHFTFRKEAKPKVVELTLAGPGSSNAPIALGEW